ncbi:hypothetical protein EV126DRAFT_423889 [Verticillium dahliae]|nr:hypothetical protein EV126DRAFT_423889 [Verticillium dahliae]
MLILKCQEADLRSSLSRIPRLAENLVYADVCSSLSSIQMLAEQILCYRVDFYCAGGRSNLRLLSRSAIPQECQSLADLFDNEHMVCKSLPERQFNTHREAGTHLTRTS